jgi:RNA polymerase sigma-70 factor, ECF subfamily
VIASRNPQARLTARFEREVLPHLDRLYGLALLLPGDSDAVEDLVEATFTAAYASFHQLPAGADPKAWLYCILLSAYRGRLRLEPPPPTAAPADPVEPVPGHSSGPARIEALRRLPDADVKHALRQLPVEARVAVYLADVQGYTYAEIAAITATPTATGTARLHHGRRQLRDRLQTHATAPREAHDPSVDYVGLVREENSH